MRLRGTKFVKVDGYAITNQKIGDSILDTALPDMDGMFDVTLIGTGENQTVTVTSDLPLPLQLNGMTVEARFRA